ncbi:hypothetical protein WA538_000334 [Blastocystis sp. DL]
MTQMRKVTTSTPEFRFNANRIHKILVEEGYCQLPAKEVDIQTPCGTYCGVEYPTNFCAVSIMRSGDSLLQAFIEAFPDAPIGKVLIQRDESTPDKRARFYYSKLPKDIENMFVFICDPMLATGGSVCEVIRLLKERNIPEERIIFLNVISAPQGIERVFAAYPNIQIVTCALDEGLNEDKYIVPGLGDYGDRFFNTLGACCVFLVDVQGVVLYCIGVY